MKASQEPERIHNGFTSCFLASQCEILESNFYIQSMKMSDVGVLLGRDEPHASNLVTSVPPPLSWAPERGVGTRRGVRAWLTNDALLLSQSSQGKCQREKETSLSLTLYNVSSTLLLPHFSFSAEKRFFFPRPI